MTDHVTDTNVGKMTPQEATIKWFEEEAQRLPNDSSNKALLKVAIEALQKYTKAIKDLEAVCRSGSDPCICCMYVENRGDLFPCHFGEWCRGEKWEWRGEERITMLPTQMSGR